MIKNKKKRKALAKYCNILENKCENIVTLLIHPTKYIGCKLKEWKLVLIKNNFLCIEG